MRTAAYLARVAGGRLSRRELLALGLPWSPELVERARRSVGATLLAADAALADGVGANLGGGTHHAFPGSGRGFCVFNDVVVAVRALRRRARASACSSSTSTCTRATARTRRSWTTRTRSRSPSTASRNYPFRRVPGDLELDLPDGTGDERYLEGVVRLLPQALARARPDLCFFLGGADPYEGDRLGRLALTQAGPRGARPARPRNARPRRRAGLRHARRRLRRPDRGHGRDQRRDAAHVRVAVVTGGSTASARRLRASSRRAAGAASCSPAGASGWSRSPPRSTRRPRSATWATGPRWRRRPRGSASGIPPCSCSSPTPASRRRRASSSSTPRGSSR